MLVAIPNKICCREGLDDLLDLVNLIRVIVAEETKVMGPRRQTPPFVGRWHDARYPPFGVHKRTDVRGRVMSLKPKDVGW
jgi:hypothetical protein